MTVQTYVHGDSAVKIARSIEDAIAIGKVGAGENLPPVRAVAAELRVSPATVAAAYRLLQERGLLVADGRRGTRVRHAAPIATPLAIALPDDVRDLSDGNPDLDLLPDLEGAMAAAGIGHRLYGETLNDPTLLELTRKQFAADGVPAGHVAVTSGALDGIERVLREHLRPGDRIIVEDPCFTGVLDLVNALSLIAVPVPVDGEGLIGAELRKAVKSADAIIVTPRAQNPTGAAITQPRARELRRILAARPQLLLIEDDHAGPVAGVPYITLVTAQQQRWAVVRSVSKSLGPDLRVALTAGDAHTIARLEGRQQLGVRWVSHLLQRLVAALWMDDHVQHQLERAAAVYADRRVALLRHLMIRGIEAHGVSGLNVWVPVLEETAVVQTLLAKGWAVQGGERYRIRSGPAIRITISTLRDQEAEELADDLEQALKPRGRARTA
ncbi:MAG TPA: aminotransferase class I/II-fold pyridoxal phosphate-dependent enzyme [Thermoanaerobaculia bacterium]|nr:aminotransferase class I/II-fold pyridoxal phosphate-dependent enzyme [Thermoanaerobaculia bacterium]